MKGAVFEAMKINSFETKMFLQAKSILLLLCCLNDYSKVKEHPFLMALIREMIRISAWKQWRLTVMWQQGCVEDVTPPIFWNLKNSGKIRSVYH